MTLTPAYGRDYKSIKAVKNDWLANKDFVIADIFSGNHGKYVNRKQLPKGATVSIRYAKLTKVVILTA